MLAKQYRLTKDKDFARVAKKGQSIFSPELGIKWIKNNLAYSRFGIVVSLRIDKKAVIRNRIKRIFRAILRENLSELKRGFDFLILVRPKLKGMNYHQMEDKLLSLLKKKDLF
ncbi:ribonuclease P protein component [Patescibacteria group bacterium]|nr:ribonuclease P protein component [Patescibacteria group bacterium]